MWAPAWVHDLLRYRYQLPLLLLLPLILWQRRAVLKNRIMSKNFFTFAQSEQHQEHNWFSVHTRTEDKQLRAIWVKRDERREKELTEFLSFMTTSLKRSHSSQPRAQGITFHFAVQFTRATCLDFTRFHIIIWTMWKVKHKQRANTEVHSILTSAGGVIITLHTCDLFFFLLLGGQSVMPSKQSLALNLGWW